MKIAYFPGCTLHEKAAGFDISARETMAALGVELVEMSGWGCCGATYPLSSENLLEFTANARNLANARKGGEQLAVACATCYNVLKRTNYFLAHDTEARDKINFFIEEEYTGDLAVLHLLEIIRDQVGFDAVRERVVRPLTGLKVAAYYGCLLLRPFAEIGLDDPENPCVLEDLMAALGAEAVFYPHRSECCGSYTAVKSIEAALVPSYTILSAAGRAGADLVVTSCPLCQFNLDRRQLDMQQKYAGFRPLPVLYFTQLLGIALGLDAEKYGLDKLYVDPRPILRERGLLRQEVPA